MAMTSAPGAGFVALPDAIEKEFIAIPADRLESDV